MGSKLLIVVMAAAGIACAQDSGPQTVTPNVDNRPVLATRQGPAVDAPLNSVVVPAGTRIPVVLEHAVSSHSARDGDAIYCKTNFPVVIDGKIVIPPGTYVQGVITHSQRAGRVKGKAEVNMKFTTLIYPSGYTVMLPGSLGGMPGSDTASIKKNDKNEGSVEGETSKTKDAGTIGTTTATGAGIGAIASRTGRGALSGAGAGAAIGLATVLLTRGPDVRLEPGAMIEISLDRPLAIDADKAKLRN